MKSEFVIMAKPNIDYTKYGFRKEKNNEYTFWLKTLRINITKSLRVHYNQVTADVIKVFCEMAKDDAIYFMPNDLVKTHTLILTHKEYEAVMKMRKEEQ